MDTLITPRFHELGSSKKNNNILENGKKKKAKTRKSLAKYKRKSISLIKVHKSNETNQTSNDIDCFLKAFNLKQKFLIRNDFDKKNCKKFLKSKFISLEEPILLDENENNLRL